MRDGAALAVPAGELPSGCSAALGAPELRSRAPRSARARIEQVEAIESLFPKDRERELASARRDRLAHPPATSASRPTPSSSPRPRRSGVTRILTVGIDGASCRAALAAAEDFPQVYAAIGRHPNAAKGFDDADLAELRALAAHERCVAIGETGLDFYRDSAPRADQQRAFAAQIALARETGKPLVIHSRAADDETLAQLAARSRRGQRRDALLLDARAAGGVPASAATRSRSRATSPTRARPISPRRRGACPRSACWSRPTRRT